MDFFLAESLASICPTPPSHHQQCPVTLPHQLQPGCPLSKGPAKIAARHWPAAYPATATCSAAVCPRKRTTPYRCASTCACARSKAATRAHWSARPITQATTKRGTYNTPGSTIWQPTFVACACKTRRAAYLSTPAAGDGRAESVWMIGAAAVSSHVCGFLSSRGSHVTTSCCCETNCRSVSAGRSTRGSSGQRSRSTHDAATRP